VAVEYDYCSIAISEQLGRRRQYTEQVFEILCPLYEAFRKYTLQKASEERDEEKESKVQRRFDMECVSRV
jgi:hypothetical protein